MGNPIGKIIDHDLTSEGVISYYDIRIGSRLFKRVPSALIEAVSKQTHEHEERD